MKKFLMLAGAAAMAVSMPALAKPDKGGKGGGGGHAAHSGGGKGGGGKANRGGGDKQHKRFSENRKKAFEGQKKRAERRFDDQKKWAERRNDGQKKRAERRFEDEKKWAERDRKRVERVREARDDRRWDRDDWREDRMAEGRFNRGRFDCPPGLDRKDNGCTPPGQARNRSNRVFSVGERWFDNDRDDGFLRVLSSRNYGDRRYRDWDDDDFIPAQYRSFYRDTPNYTYRYDDDGYIYRVNRQTNLISGLIPLLGGGFGVGQVLPAGYNVYNVPYQYRSTYYDTDDYHYRYGGNAIYQVDPRSNMITNVATLLAPNMFGVGQPLPVGYDMYNVPMQYRDRYYDTDQYNYRYANGSIYQVDPTTQLITAIISALI